MEDDEEEASDGEGGGDAGADGVEAAESASANPFDNLTELFCHNAHLTVFINYVISNSDPSSLVIFATAAELYFASSLSFDYFSSST